MTRVILRALLDADFVRLVDRAAGHMKPQTVVLFATPKIIADFSRPHDDATGRVYIRDGPQRSRHRQELRRVPGGSAVYLRDLGFDGILYRNQLGTRGRWLAEMSPGRSDAETAAISAFFEYSERKLDELELMWF